MTFERVNPHDHRRNFHPSQRSIDVERVTKPVFKSRFLDPKIRFQEMQFVSERNEVVLRRLQRVSEHFGQFFRQSFCFFRAGVNEARQDVRCIEQEMLD